MHPPLDRCPDCGYPLAGLPPADRCPECGFAYDDARMILIEGTGPVRRSFRGGWRVEVAVNAVFVMGGVLLANYLGRTGKLKVSPLILFAPLVVFALIYGWRRLQAKAAGRASTKMLLTPDGFAMADFDRPFALRPWPPTARVAVDEWGSDGPRLRIYRAWPVEWFHVQEYARLSFAAPPGRAEAIAAQVRQWIADATAKPS